MKLAYSFIAKAGEFAKDGSFAVLGGDIEAIVSDFPAVVPSLIFIGKIDFDEAEIGRSSVLRIQLLDTTGKNILPDDGEHKVIAQARAESPSKKPRSGFAAQLVGMTFPTDGEYRFTVSVDGNEIGSNSLFLVKPVLFEETPS